MDITDDPVSHLVWEAVLTKVPSKEYVAVPPPCTPARASGGDDKGWGMGQAVGGAALATSRAIGGVVGARARDGDRRGGVTARASVLARLLCLTFGTSVCSRWLDL